MVFSEILNDSIEYMTEALIGKWSRWLVFFVLNLPYALIPLAFDTALFMTSVEDESFIPTPEFYLSLIKWEILIPLLIVGVITSAIVSGYIVRIYSGTRPAPDFTGFGELFCNGVKAWIIEIVWFLPFAIVVLVQIVLMLVALNIEKPAGVSPLLVIFLLLLPVQFVLFIIACFFSMVGPIRFARTGSFTEGVRFSAVLADIRRIGWVNLMVSGILLMIIGFCFNMGIGILSMIPYTSMIFNPLLTPLMIVLSARFMCDVYDIGNPVPVLVEKSPV